MPKRLTDTEVQKRLSAVFPGRKLRRRYRNKQGVIHAVVKCICGNEYDVYQGQLFSNNNCKKCLGASKIETLQSDLNEKFPGREIVKRYRDKKKNWRLKIQCTCESFYDIAQYCASRQDGCGCKKRTPKSIEYYQRRMSTFNPETKNRVISVRSAQEIEVHCDYCDVDFVTNSNGLEHNACTVCNGSAYSLDDWNDRLHSIFPLRTVTSFIGSGKNRVFEIKCECGRKYEAKADPCKRRCPHCYKKSSRRVPLSELQVIVDQVFPGRVVEDEFKKGKQLHVWVRCTCKARYSQNKHSLSKGQDGCPKCGPNVRLLVASEEKVAGYKEALAQFRPDDTFVELRYVEQRLKAFVICGKCSKPYEQRYENVHENGCDCSKKTVKFTKQQWNKRLQDVSPGNEVMKIWQENGRAMARVMCGRCKAPYKQHAQELHLYNGCESCGGNRFYSKHPAFIYYLTHNERWFKIGITNVGVDRRYKMAIPSKCKQLRVLGIVWFSTGAQAKSNENLVKKTFSEHNRPYRFLGPKVRGHTEWFNRDIFEGKTFYMGLKDIGANLSDSKRVTRTDRIGWWYK